MNAKDQPQPANFNIDPAKAPVLFADTYLISSGNGMVTFNFAQSVIGGSQLNIVSRVALTPDQARDLLKNLSDHIQKFEV